MGKKKKVLFFPYGPILICNLVIGNRCLKALIRNMVLVFDGNESYRPICSAMLMNLWEKMETWMVSRWVPSRLEIPLPIWNEMHKFELDIPRRKNVLDYFFHFFFFNSIIHSIQSLSFFCIFFNIRKWSSPTTVLDLLIQGFTELYASGIILCMPLIDFYFYSIQTFLFYFIQVIHCKEAVNVIQYMKTLENTMNTTSGWGWKLLY